MAGQTFAGASQHKAQAGITLRRVSDGSTLSTMFRITNAGGSTGLFQIVSSDDGSVAPDWKASPVTIEPVTNADGAPCPLSGHEWLYNNVRLVFAADGTCTNYPQFKLAADKKSLVIRDNLASSQNTDSDMITYRGEATLNGRSNVKVERTADIMITETGQNVYKGFITPQEAFIGGEFGNTVKLTARLYKGTEEIQLGNENVTWYRGNVDRSNILYSKPYSLPEITVAGATTKASATYTKAMELTVSRALVNGSCLIIAKFHSGLYTLNGSDEVWEQAAAYVTDVEDEFMIDLRSDIGANVADGATATVTARLIQGETEATGVTPTWKLTPLQVESLAPAVDMAVSNTNTIAVTSAQLDKNDGQVLIVADATW